MIRAVIFDLDGTLVQTEKLKAISYAKAATELRPGEIFEHEVVEAFKEVVGLSRRRVAKYLLGRFGLEKAASARMQEFRVSKPWQAFVQVRLKHYQAMISDPEVLRSSVWKHNIALLDDMRRKEYKIGLATMSYCEQAGRVLEILGLQDAFDFVATRDDVERGKPDPEIYQLVADELGVSPSECLVIEDSPTGVQAALAAGMRCIAVATPFTHRRLREDCILSERWIVYVPDRLPGVVMQMYEERLRD